jgi:acetyl-CoA synthetase
MASESDMPVGKQLDRQLAELLEVERFAPPSEFREQALLNDPAIYEQAAQDPQGWWARQAEQLHWFRGWATSPRCAIRPSQRSSRSE